MFDAYHRWLGISPEEQPPDHYRLLGLRRFESDADIIDAAADRQLLFLHQLSNDPNADLAERLANEVSEARLCLLDDAARDAYDRTLTTTPRPPAADPAPAAPPAIQPSPVQTHPPPAARRRRRGPSVLGAVIGAAVPAVTVIGVVFYWSRNPGAQQQFAENVRDTIGGALGIENPPDPPPADPAPPPPVDPPPPVEPAAAPTTDRPSLSRERTAPAPPAVPRGRARREQLVGGGSVFDAEPFPPILDRDSSDAIDRSASRGPWRTLPFDLSGSTFRLSTDPPPPGHRLSVVEVRPATLRASVEPPDGTFDGPPVVVTFPEMGGLKLTLTASIDDTTTVTGKFTWTAIGGRERPVSTKRVRKYADELLQNQRVARAAVTAQGKVIDRLRDLFRRATYRETRNRAQAEIDAAMKRFDVLTGTADRIDAEVTAAKIASGRFEALADGAELVLDAVAEPAAR